MTISLKDQLNNDLFLIKHDFVTEGRNTIFFDKEDAITKYHQADKETLSFKMHNFAFECIAYRYMILRRFRSGQTD